MFESIKELFLAIMVAFLFLGITIVVVSSSIYLVNKNISCPKLSESLERPTKYDFWAGGCFVQDTNGQWVYSSNYHAIDIQK